MNMVEFVILSTRPFQNLPLMLVVIFPTRFVKIVFFCCFLSFFCFNGLKSIIYRLSGLISIGFERNIDCMFTSNRIYNSIFS